MTIIVGTMPSLEITNYKKIHYLVGFGRRGHDNAATLFAFGFGSAVDLTDQATLAAVIGQHQQGGASDTDLSLIHI